jgi:hypothetical protein
MPSDAGGWEPGRRTQGDGTGRQKPKADTDTIQRALRILLASASVAELRVLISPRWTVSGYFDDLGKMTECAAAISGKAEGVYLTLNPVSPALLARASNHLREQAKHTTVDRDVLHRRWFLIDFDPVRPAGISSTDAEHKAALDRAKACRDWLRSQGWPEPLFADSGNGAHLLHLIDLPNDDQSAALLKSCLIALGMLFSDSTVEVDPGTYNASRISKVYGTLAAKGDNLPERPHRLASLLDVPENRTPVTAETLEALARRVPKAESHRGQPASSQFDCPGWIAAHNLEVDAPKDWQGGRLWVLRFCPWNPNHRKSAFILQFPNGAVAAGCLHKSCEGKDWHALRDVIEPGWKIHSAQYRDGARAEWNITFRTAAEVAAQTPEEVEWIVRPWVAKGTITEVEGKIKSAGKTTFVTHMVAAVLDGASFMGQPTTKTPVVYLTEQPPTSFRQALARARLLERKDLSLLFWQDVMPVPWPVVARAAIEECKRLGSKLLVVDTGAQFAKLVGDSENNAGDVLQAMQPLQEATAAGIAVILVWHERKSGGDVGDAGRGSCAVGGAVDVVLAIRRPGGNSRPTIRAIQTRSRFDETPEEWMVELTGQEYVALGQSHEVEAQRVKEAILAAAPQTEGDSISLTALLEAAATTRATGQRVIEVLRKEGKLVRLGKGKKGDPYKFWRPSPHSARGPNTNGQKEPCGVVSEVL